MLRVEQYATTPESVEAVQLIPENAGDVARWVGGRVESEAKASDPTDVSTNVLVPTLRGALRVSMGQYVLRDKTLGSFFAMEQSEFSKKYTRVGLRQDGPGFSKGPILGRSSNSSERV